MGPIGLQEMIAIFVIALVLFGPKKLPELGRMLGRAISEFRRAKNELRSTFESHLQELERETRFNDPISYNPPDYSHSRYSYPYEDYNHYDADLPQAQNPRELNASSAPQLEAPGAADTVPRANGVKPVESVPATEEQERPA